MNERPQFNWSEGGTALPADRRVDEMPWAEPGCL